MMSTQEIRKINGRADTRICLTYTVVHKKVTRFIFCEIVDKDLYVIQLKINWKIINSCSGSLFVSLNRTVVCLPTGLQPLVKPVHLRSRAGDFFLIFQYSGFFNIIQFLSKSSSPCHFYPSFFHIYCSEIKNKTFRLTLTAPHYRTACSFLFFISYCRYFNLQRNSIFQFYTDLFTIHQRTTHQLCPEVSPF